MMKICDESMARDLSFYFKDLFYLFTKKRNQNF